MRRRAVSPGFASGPGVTSTVSPSTAVCHDGASRSDASTTASIASPELRTVSCSPHGAEVSAHDGLKRSLTVRSVTGISTTRTSPRPSSARTGTVVSPRGSFALGVSTTVPLGATCAHSGVGVPSASVAGANVTLRTCGAGTVSDSPRVSSWAG